MTETIEEIDDSCDPEETMPEGMLHAAVAAMLLQAFADFYRDRDDALVVGNLMWYWEEGNRKACGAPDAMIVLGVAKDSMRDSFESWKEDGAVPAAAFEMASERTWRVEIGKKFDDYERQGVAEYFIVDPETRFHEAPLQGFRLVDGRYEPIPFELDGSMASELGVRLRFEGLFLRVIDAATGKVVPTPAEERATAKRDAARIRRKAARLLKDAVRANDEIRRLRAQLGLPPGDPIP